MSSTFATDTKSFMLNMVVIEDIADQFKECFSNFREKYVFGISQLLVWLA